MLLGFHRLGQIPFQFFDGLYLLIPAEELKSALGDTEFLSENDPDYYLAVGIIQRIPEVLLLGTMQESGLEFHIEPAMTYQFPVALMADLQVAILGSLRQISMHPLIQEVNLEILDRKHLRAARLDAELDHLRIKDFPDSYLVSVLDSDEAIAHVISVDELELIGPKIYKAKVHASKEGLPAEGETVYVKKVLREDSPWAGLPVLLLLPEAPVLEEGQIRKAKVSGYVDLYTGKCTSCLKISTLMLGPEILDDEALQRYTKEIREGLWGVGLFAFALEHETTDLLVARALYHCPYCKAWEERRRVALFSADDRREYQPLCSDCGHQLYRYRQPIESSSASCFYCGSATYWRKSQDLHKAEEMNAPTFLAEDFEILTLDELARIRKAADQA